MQLGRDPQALFVLCERCTDTDQREEKIGRQAAESKGWLVDNWVQRREVPSIISIAPGSRRETGTERT